MKKLFSSALGHLVAPGMAVVLALLAGRVAWADFIVTLTQQGSNVVATGSGEIDLTGLSLLIPAGSGGTAMFPGAGFIVVGPVSNFVDAYGGIISHPTSFGTGGNLPADSGSGDVVGATPVYLYVPSGYTSDSPLSDSATWDNLTFSSLGVTPGNYEWSWGTGTNQNFTLEIQAVPEPSLFGLVAVVLVAWLGPRIVRRRQSGTWGGPATL
jgi:hypothetical protein